MRAGRESAVRALAVEAILPDVLATLSRGGVTPLLIKGPAVARWLYDDPAERRSDDIDLLVAPAERAAAGRALAAAGFERLPVNGRDAALHAAVWVRDGPLPIAVDLHHSLCLLVGRDPSAVWRALRAGASCVAIAGARVWVPSPPAHALILALHAAQHGRAAVKPLEDLRRALVRVGAEDWRAAAALARSLDAEPAFAAGLRMLPAGASLADALGLTDRRTARLDVYLDNGPVHALTVLDLLAAAGSAREGAGLLVRMIFPTAEYLRRAQPLARRGPAGRAMARILRLPWLAGRALAGLRVWRDVLREEAGGPPVEAVRRAVWALRALRACRAQLRSGALLAAVRLPAPPACRSGDERGLGRALRLARASCLERSLIRQRWRRSRGDERDLVVGVTAPGQGFAAHAWLAGDRSGTSFAELVRRAADAA